MFANELYTHELSQVVGAIYNPPEASVGSYLSMRVLARLLRKLATLDIEQHGILPASYGVLLALQDREYCTPTELKVQLLVSRSNMTSLLDRMVRDGLIRREPDPDDRRKIRIALTEQGKSISDQILDPHLIWVRDTMFTLSSEELEALNQILGKLW
jgi:MarR family 2-MHQ and catechol resistance regulon transcriptional repressor